MKTSLFALFMLFSFQICTAREAEEVVVQLQSQNEVTPVAFPKWIVEEGSLESIAELQEAFRFDFENNGRTRPIYGDKTRISSSWDMWKEVLRWKELGALFVVQVKISKEGLFARVFNLYAQTVKTLGPLPLEKTSQAQRKQIHMLSDGLFKSLFQANGIASSKILYSVKSKDSKEGKWLSDIWEADYDGKNARKVTENAGFSISPIYIPQDEEGQENSHFIFVSYKTGQPKLYVGSLKNTQVQRLSLLRGNQFMPALTYGKHLLAFISDVSGNPDLFVQEFSTKEGLTGQPRQIYSAGKSVQATPTFDPTGKKVAFVSNKDGAPRIYVMDVPEAQGSLKKFKPKLVTRYTRESSAPNWSPDGKKIAYCALTAGVRQIWVYDLETDEERQLTEGPGAKENPSWAKDSLHLMYNCHDGRSCDLFLIDLFRKKPVKVTQGPGEKSYPAFST